NDADFSPVLLSIDPAEHGDPRIMPSVLYFNPDGSVLAGRSALALAEIQPTNAVTSIKRALGLRHMKSYAGREYDATTITSKIIEQLLERAEDGLFRLGDYKTPRQAVVTVPIEFNNSQRRALLEACRVAGLDMPDTSQHGVVIDEAHAAALYYLSRKAADADISDAPEKVLIFDFGGGTLDCALVEIERVSSRMVLRTLAPGGNPKLGGEDIDWALVGVLADKAKRAFPAFDLNCLGDEQKFEHLYRVPEVMIAAYRTRSRFKREAESAKIALTEIPKVEFKIEPLFKIEATPFEPYIMNGNGLASFDVQLTRDELQAVLEPFIVASERVVATLCERARVRPDEVQTILHVGRTSKLPLVRERINAMLPNAVDHSDLVEPKVCVALGAAFWGYIKDHPDTNFEFVGVGNQLIHDLGYITLDGMQEVFRPVFTARTEYPCERVLNFPRKDFINIRLAENRGKNPRIRDNAEISRIGNVRIDARGVSGDELPVVFRINDNQILEIIANDHRQAIELD
ncbi:MAG TPA: Hsp70 family protein, partial [Pyrinomonadaceae bacterium]|nr:Hsp70 family protein [Pyrinomonadaceae bacterium]